MGRFLEVALEFLFIYFLYRLVFDFIIPIYRSSKKVKEHMEEMQHRMHDNLQQQRQANTPPPQQAKPLREGEYIDYEEVKENKS